MSLVHQSHGLGQALLTAWRFLDEQYERVLEELQRAFCQLLRETDPHLHQWLLKTPEETPDRYVELVQMMRSGST